jgi:carboxylesterase type B
MPGRKWCKAFMAGESKLDVSPEPPPYCPNTNHCQANILAYMGLDDRNPGIAQKFINSANRTLSSQPNAVTQLCLSYNITPHTKDDEALIAILRFASEVSFYAPARAFAQGWPNTPDNKFFLYHFNEGIPWDGRFKGEAGHILDVSYLFQNYDEHMNDAQQKVAKEFADAFIKFVNGENPWPPVLDEKLGAMVYGPSADGVTSRWVSDGDPVKVGRDERILKLGEMAGGLHVIAEVFQNFFQGQ